MIRSIWLIIHGAEIAYSIVQARISIHHVVCSKVLDLSLGVIIFWSLCESNSRARPGDFDHPTRGDHPASPTVVDSDSPPSNLGSPCAESLP